MPSPLPTAGTRAVDGGCEVDILVAPRASRAKIGPIHAGRIKVAVTSPPVDGAANTAIVELFAKALHIRKSAVEIAKGQSSRRKTIRLVGVDVGAVEALL